MLVFQCAPKPLLLARATGGDQIGGSGVGAERGYPPPPAKRIPFVSPPPPGTVLKAGPGSLPPFKRGRAAQNARPRSRSAQPGIAMGKAEEVHGGVAGAPRHLSALPELQLRSPGRSLPKQRVLGVSGQKSCARLRFFLTATARGGEARFGEKKIY